MTTTRVLIVDDNPMNLALAQVVLEAGGFTVESADDGPQALARVKLFRPDVVLTDIQMPGMDGLELTQVLKADPETRHIAIVAFTAFAMRGDEARMRAAGCDGYLSKPIDVNRFAAQVRACLLPAAGAPDAPDAASY